MAVFRDTEGSEWKKHPKGWLSSRLLCNANNIFEMCNQVIGSLFDFHMLGNLM